MPLRDAGGNNAAGEGRSGYRVQEAAGAAAKTAPDRAPCTKSRLLKPSTESVMNHSPYLF
jgi:hypothetical protein